MTVNPSDVEHDPHRTVMDPESLLELGMDLERAGGKWLKPIVVKHGGMARPVLLGGERRFAARVRLGPITSMRVYQVSDWTGFLAWLMRDQTQPGRTDLNLVEAARLTIKIRRYMHITRADRVDEMISLINSLDIEKLRDTRYAIDLIEKLPEHLQESSRAHLRLIETGAMQAGSVYARIKVIRDKWNADRGGRPAHEQRNVLQRSVNTLEGLMDAVNGRGGRSDGLTKDECAAWESKVRKACTDLGRLAKKLKTKGEQ